MEGTVELKRLTSWVTRYAELTQGVLYYYKNKGDTRPSQAFSLAKASISELSLSSSEQFVIQFIDGDENRVLFKFNSSTEQHRWFKAFRKAAAAVQPSTKASSNTSTAPASVNSNTSTVQGIVSALNSGTPTVAGVGATVGQSGAASQFGQFKGIASDDNLSIFQESNVSYAIGQSNVRNCQFDMSFVTAKKEQAIPLIEQIKEMKANKFNASNMILVDAVDSLRVFANRETISLLDQFVVVRVFIRLISDYKRFASNIMKSSQLQATFGAAFVILAILMYQIAQIFSISAVYLIFLECFNLLFAPSLSLYFQQIFSEANHMRQSESELNCMAIGTLALRLNEFIVALVEQASQRKYYQTGVVECTVDSNDRKHLKVSFVNGQQEDFIQEVFVDETGNVYIVEASRGGSKNKLHRVFEIPAETISMQHFVVNYYFAVSNHSEFNSVSSTRTKNSALFYDSPILLNAIVSFVHAKRNYFNQSVNRKTAGTAQNGLDDSMISSATSTAAIMIEGNLFNSHQNNNNYYRNQLGQQQQLQPLQLSQTHSMPGRQNNNNAASEGQQLQANNKNQKYPVLQLQNSASTPVEQSQKKEITITQETGAQKVNGISSSITSPVVVAAAAAATVPADNAGQKEQNNLLKEPFLLSGEAGVKFNELLQTSFKHLKQYAPLNSENNWNAIEKKADHTTHSRVDSGSGIVMGRGETTVARPLSVVVEFIKNPNNRGTWDEMFKESKEIERFTENTSIEHNMFKGVMLVSGRDICLIQSNFEINGIHYFFGTSVVHPNVPEQKKFVRANLKIGGWVITPVEGGAKTNCVYLTCCDPSGGLNSSLKEYAAKQQGLNAIKLKKAIEKTK